MSLTLTPSPILQFCDEDGVPVAGGLLYIYESGTDDPATTWQDVDGNAENENPIELDAGGYAPPIYLAAASYKYVLHNANDVLMWERDPIGSVGLQSSGIGQGMPLYGDPTSPITGTSYPVGTTADKLHAGTVIIPLDSGDLSGTFKLRGMLMGNGGGTVTAALVNLSDGSPETAMVTISSGSTTGATQTSGEITFPGSGATKNYGVKVKVDTGSGFAWGLELVRTA